jgi:Ferritin-like domain
MEISERSLRQMVREVDDRHREGMKTIRDDIAALHTSRRRFLRDAGAGLAVVIGASVVPFGALTGSAAAQSAAPAKPLTDAQIATFAESVELAAVAVYTQVLASGKLTTPAVIAAATLFKSHHMDHAQAFGAFAGDAATAKPNPGVLQAVGDQVSEASDQPHMLAVAFSTENAAAATYLYAIGLLSSVEALAACASIMPVEAEHATLLGYVLGLDADTDADYVPPFQAPDQALLPSAYPVAS